MSRVKRLKNISKQGIEVHFSGGGRAELPPGNVLENVNVTNLGDLLQFTEVTRDLTEVGDYSHVERIRQRLNS